MVKGKGVDNVKITVSNEITIENPTTEVMGWAVDKLKVPNPEYANKLKLGLWLGSTPKELKLYRISGDRLIIPYGVKKSLWAFLADRSSLVGTFDYDEALASNKPIDYDSHINLYDYQQDALNALLNARGGILQSKAGSGKTRTGIALICALGKKALWLTHTNELLSQSYNAAAKFIDKSLLGKISAGRFDISSGITFATVQTLSKADLNALRHEWDVVVVDECHRCSGSVKNATMFSKVLNNLAAPYKYGLSATLHRADGLILCTFALLGGVAHRVPDDVVNTMQVRIEKKETGVQISRACLDTDGTLVYAKLINYLAEHEDRNKQIVYDIYDLYESHSIILLSDRVCHLTDIYNLLPPHCKDSTVVLHGKVKKADREQALEQMRNKEKHILLATYQLAKEGLDVPCLDRLLLATPVKDYAIVVQSVGRIARVCDNKGTPVVYDYVDDIGFLQGMWKKRCTHYRKDGCVI